MHACLGHLQAQEGPTWHFGQRAGAIRCKSKTIARTQQEGLAPRAIRRLQRILPAVARACHACMHAYQRTLQDMH